MSLLKKKKNQTRTERVWLCFAFLKRRSSGVMWRHAILEWSTRFSIHGKSWIVLDFDKVKDV